MRSSCFKISPLIAFIEKEITTKVLQEDLNTLLPADVFKRYQKILKPEVLRFLRGEIDMGKG